MATPRKYFHDHYVLLLVSTNVFLTLLATLLILFRVGSGHGNGYIVQCRDCSNPTDVTKFMTGGVTRILGFIAFAFIVMITHLFLSIRCYRINRQLALTILGLGAFLLVLTIIISNALLVLR